MSFFSQEPILRSLYAKFNLMVTLYIDTHYGWLIRPFSKMVRFLLIVHRPWKLTKFTLAISITLIHLFIFLLDVFDGVTLLQKFSTLIMWNPTLMHASGCYKSFIIVFSLRPKNGHPVSVTGHFQYAMFCFSILVCFDDKLDENHIKQIKEVQRWMLVNFSKFNILNLWPRVTKIV